MINTLILDRGHGTLDANGRYVTAGKRATLSDGTVVYEGILNQLYSTAIYRHAITLGFRVEFSTPALDSYEDTPLYARTLKANNSKYRKSSIFISSHNNAFKGESSGTEIFTSIGQTLSDIYAEHMLLEIKKEFPTRKIRSDKSDGDLDKEAKFVVLTNTHMPAVLIEYGFFDNLEEYKFLIKPETIDKMALAIVQGTINAIIALYGKEAWENRNI